MWKGISWSGSCVCVCDILENDGLGKEQEIH